MNVDDDLAPGQPIEVNRAYNTSGVEEWRGPEHYAGDIAAVRKRYQADLQRVAFARGRVREVTQPAPENQADVDASLTLGDVDGVHEPSGELLGLSGWSRQSHHDGGNERAMAKHDQSNDDEVRRCCGPGRLRLIVVNVESV